MYLNILPQNKNFRLSYKATKHKTVQTAKFITKYQW